MSGDQRVLAAGLFVVAWGTNISTPLILRYQDRLALSDTGAVGIFSVYVVGILLALLFAGRVSDRVGRRRVVVPFTIASSLGSLVLMLGRDSLPTLFAGRFLLGAVSGSMLSVGTAWIVELGDRDGDIGGDRQLRLASITTTVIYLGFGFGPITSALYDRFGSEPLVVPYLVHAGITLVIAAVLVGLEETKEPDPDVSLRPRLTLPHRHRSEFVRVVLPSAIWVFGFPSVSFALLPLILRDSIGSFDVLIAGVIGTLTAFAVFLSRPILDRVRDARAALPVALWVGVGGYTLGLVAFVTGAWYLAPIAAVALGAASGTLMSGGLAITEELADDSNRGALTATFYLVAYCGMTMPLIITALSQIVTTTIALAAVTVAAAFVAISTSLDLGTHRHESRAELPENDSVERSADSDQDRAG